ncbi:MAG: hypothetical protein KME13_08885 [Myxacorys californica WJT36-NPBG1]|nr:hypothetical protein [Myxacorys californica WJT36-NPBG1]
MQAILEAASNPLLAALNAVVSQYQTESEAEQQIILVQQAELYQQSCKATAVAQAQTQQLEQSLAELHQLQTHLIQTARTGSQVSNQTSRLSTIRLIVSQSI